MERKGALPAILAIAAVLRLYQLGAPSLSGDESGGVFYGSYPLDMLVEAIVATGEVHPPGFYAFVHMLLSVNSAEWFLRLPSVLFALLTILVSYSLFRRWGAESTAMLAAGLLAVSTYHIQASRELRMYSLLTLLVVVSLTCLYRWLESGKSGWLAGYALACGLNYWNHYLSFFALPVGCVWVLLWSWRRVGPWLGAVVVSGIPFLFWLPILRQQVGGANLVIRSPVTLFGIVEMMGRMQVGDIGPMGSYLLAGLGLLLPLIVAGAGWRDFKDRNWQLATVWLFLPMVMLSGISMLTSLRIFEFKYFVWVAPAFAWLLATALGRLAESWRNLLLVALVVANLVTYSIMFVDHLHYGPNWRGVAGYLRAHLRPGEHVVIHPSMMAQPLLYYGIGHQQMWPVDQPTEERLAEIAGSGVIYFVTTPHHPFVARERLELRFDQVMKRTGTIESKPSLPSAFIRVVRFEPKSAPKLDNGESGSGTD